MKCGRMGRYKEFPGKYKEIEGEKPILLIVPHAKMPKGELYTPEIGQEIACSLNTHLLVGDVSRIIIDLNRSEANSHPFRMRIKELLSKKRIRLILDLHGMKDEEPIVEIGTLNGGSATSHTIDIFRKHLEKAGFKVLIDRKFKGEERGTIISTFSNPPSVEALQIKFAYYIRNNEELRDKLTNSIKKGIEEYLNEVVIR